MIKSQRLTSYYHNKIKHTNILFILNELTEIRKQMNEYIFNNKEKLLSYKTEKELKSKFSLFKSDFIFAWNIQKEFQFIISLYKNRINQLKQRIKIRLQDKIKATYYKRATKLHKKGDVKTFEIKHKSTPLTRFIKYLIYLDLDNDIREQLTHAKNREVLLKLYEYYKSKPYWDRIINLARKKQKWILSEIKQINFKKLASIRLSSQINKARIDFDDTNTKYKYWFVFNLYKKQFKLPLQINQNYHRLNDLISKEFILNLSEKGNKINISTTYEEDESLFKQQAKIEGLDINVKHSFAVLSDGTEFDYDRDYLKSITKTLLKLDKIGYQNLEEKDLKRLKKTYRRLEWYVNYLIHNILDELKKKGITDLVIEDLLLKDRLYAFNEEFGLKYSRLIKLLRLSDVKNILIRQAEKRGMRIHLTPSFYTSQQCQKCGHISHRNRKTQEIFECEECGFKTNADFNASINLKNRFLVDVLREKLHKKDKFGRLIPKDLSKFKTKNILLEFASSRSQKRCCV